MNKSPMRVSLQEACVDERQFVLGKSKAAMRLNKSCGAIPLTIFLSTDIMTVWCVLFV